MPEFVTPNRSTSGWPVSHLNAGSAAWTEIKTAAGANQSHYITGICLTGGGSADGVTFIRRTALKFAAASNTITVSDNAALEPAAGDFAIEFGAKFESTAVSITNVIHKDDGSDQGYFVGLTSGGNLYCTIGDGSNTATITSYKHVNDGKWHHFIINCDISETDGLQMFIDGKSAALAVDPTSVSGITGGATNLTLNGGASKTWYLSTLGIYKGQILSAAEIATRWADGAGSKFVGTETGISAAWNIDEGTGATVYDLVGSNDGTIANAAWEDGIGLPIDSDTLPQVGKFNTGIISTNGGINGVQMSFPEAIKVGRNAPIRIVETDGAFDLVVFGYTNCF